MVLMISERTAAMVKDLRRRAQLTKETYFFDDVYQLFLPDRPVGGWDSGAILEQLTVRAEGACKLYANGVGGPRTDEVLYPESPYRVRLAVQPIVALAGGDGTVPNLMNGVVVINHARVFQIDDFKVEDSGDYLGDLYLTERPGKAVSA